MRIGEIGTVVQLKDCIKILERYNLRKLWAVYPRGQPRRHFTLTGRGNPNPPDIGTTRPHIHRTPLKATKARHPQPPHKLPTNKARATDAGHSQPRQRLPGAHLAKGGLV